MPPKSDTHIIIVGAGLAGSLMACYLAQAGYRVTVFERRSDPRIAGTSSGRSINLALSARGLAGLAGAGLAETVMQADAIPMRGRMIHPASSTTSSSTTTPALFFQPYSSNPTDAINSVSRSGLNLTLLKAAAAYRHVSVVFDHPCIDVDLDAPAAIFQTARGEVRYSADLILGADGAFSPVRARLQKTDRFEYSQTYLGHGYKELHIPAARDLRLDERRFNGFAMDPNALHIWPRGGAMMIALPNRDCSFTCTLFWPFQGDHGFESLRTPEHVLAFFARTYPDAVPLMPTLATDYFANPTGSLVTIRCWPWRSQGKVCILGDAAHAIVPFYGQGMNAAFEDCLTLAHCLAEHKSDTAAALEEFQTTRKPNADAIADMALENFIEMRDKVGSLAFLYKKKLEQEVHQLAGERLTPQYNLVSFSTVPYTQAQQRGRLLNNLLEHLIEHLPVSTLRELGEDQWRIRVKEVATGLMATPAGTQSAGAERNETPGEVSPPRIYDITPAVTTSMKVWPGDTPLSREVLCDIAKGDTITLSTIRATVHLGAHADGPNHYGKDAPGIGEQSLHHYLGPCQVVDVRVARGARIQTADLVGGIGNIHHPRILLRTGTFPDHTTWNDDFAALSVELLDALAARRVITIGIDTPSVDLQTSKDLPAHHAILKHNIAILEGLDLRNVPPGDYELIAPPLKLMGFDASPIRAVLRGLR